MKNKKSKSAAAQARALVLAGTMMAGSLFAGNHDKESMSTNQGLCFTENKGQISDENYKARPDILFSGSQNGCGYYLRNNGITYQFSEIKSWKTENIGGAEQQIEDQVEVYDLNISWKGMNTNAKVSGNSQLNGLKNYYTSSCPDGAIGVRSFREVNYTSVYPGIDLKWYTKNNQLKYDYYLAAGADYKQIRMQIDGATGIRINEKGELVISTPKGDLIEHAPLVLQEGRTLKSAWMVQNNEVSYKIEGVNPEQPMVIDPFVRLWATYFGGSGDDNPISLERFYDYWIIMSGFSNSTNNIVPNSNLIYQHILSGQYDAFVAQFHINGQYVSSTYYGGTGNDYAYNCKVDSNLDMFIVGETNSATNIASGGAFSTLLNKGNSSTNYDGFLVRLSSMGSGGRVFGTYYGSTNNDKVNDLVLVGSEVYICGETYDPSADSDIATAGTLYSTKRGSVDGFLVHMTNAGARVWGTFYGGTGIDVVTGVDYDGLNKIYISGYTNSSSGISTLSSHQTSFGGMNDAFLAKMTFSGTRNWGTYYGGSGDEWGLVDVETFGTSTVYLCGRTSSLTGIATAGGCQSVYGGGDRDGFLTKFNSSGVRQWGTYYGGSAYDDIMGMDVAGSGFIYLSGKTTSPNNIATLFDYQSTYADLGDYYLVKISPTGPRVYATYYGGSDIESCFPVFVGKNVLAFSNEAVFVCGGTYSSSGIATLYDQDNNPVFQNSRWANRDGFLVKFTEPANGQERLATVTNAVAGIETPQLSVAPNPSNGIFQIAFDAVAESDYVLEITNTLGQIVVSEQLTGFSGNYQKNFDLSVYDRGMYNVRLRSAQGESTIKVITY